jgi:hypothetical protein
MAHRYAAEATDDVLWQADIRVWHSRRFAPGLLEVAQQRPHSPVAIRGTLSCQIAQLLEKMRIVTRIAPTTATSCRSARSALDHIGACDAQHTTHRGNTMSPASNHDERNSAYSADVGQ